MVRALNHDKKNVININDFSRFRHKYYYLGYHIQIKVSVMRVIPMIEKLQVNQVGENY